MNIKERSQEIRKQIEELHAQISEKLKEISAMESSCLHNWTQPKLCCRRLEYGIDAFGGSYDDKFWERECLSCGIIERTYKVGMIEVPDFGH